MDKQFRKLINAQQKNNLTSSDMYMNFVTTWDVDSITHVDYWKMLPEYTISRCPICNVPYRQLLDTYSLYLWSIRHYMASVQYSKRGYDYCKHFVGVHTFLNLDGQNPYTYEMYGEKLFSSEPEVPMISANLLPDDIETYVVLHSLPICRVRNDRLLPKYLLFMLTYYSVDKRELERRRLLEWTGGREALELLDVGAPWGDGNKRLAVYWEEAEQQPLAWNLDYWVKQKKLFWLDLVQDDLPLTNYEQKFPYTDLKGVKHGYKYHKDSYEVVPTRFTIEKFRANLDNFLIAAKNVAKNKVE